MQQGFVYNSANSKKLLATGCTFTGTKPITNFIVVWKK